MVGCRILPSKVVLDLLGGATTVGPPEPGRRAYWARLKGG
jgi:hypothetical protein